MKQSHKHKMKYLPMLGELRESVGLSQRRLARMSGVAHDTISQIERRKRKARSSTAWKLADAIGVTPSILELSLEELSTFTEEGLVDLVREDLSDDPPRRRISSAEVVIEALFTYLGYSREEEAEWEERKATASYKLHKDIDVASKKINPAQDNPDSDELAEMAEATVLLARASTQLLRLVTSELGSPLSYPFSQRGRRGRERDRSLDYLSYLSKFGSRFGRPLVDASLEGATATKAFMDVIDKANSPTGRGALEGESNSEGGDQAGVVTEK